MATVSNQSYERALYECADESSDHPLFVPLEPSCHEPQDHENHHDTVTAVNDSKPSLKTSADHRNELRSNDGRAKNSARRRPKDAATGTDNRVSAPLTQGMEEKSLQATLAPDAIGDESNKAVFDLCHLKEIKAYKKRIKKIKKEARSDAKEAETEIANLRNKLKAANAAKAYVSSELEKAVQESHRLHHSQRGERMETYELALQKLNDSLDHAKLEIESLRDQLRRSVPSLSMRDVEIRQPIRREGADENEILNLRDEVVALKKILASRDDPYRHFDFAHQDLLAASHAAGSLDEETREAKLKEISKRHRRKESSTQLLASARGQRGHDPHREIAGRPPSRLILPSGPASASSSTSDVPRRSRGRPRKSIMIEDRNVSSGQTDVSCLDGQKKKRGRPKKRSMVCKDTDGSDDGSEWNDEGEDRMEREGKQHKIIRQEQERNSDIEDEYKGDKSEEESLPSAIEALRRFDEMVGIPKNPRPLRIDNALVMRDGTLVQHSRPTCLL